MIEVKNEMGRRRKYRTFDQLTPNEKKKNIEYYINILTNGEDNDPEAAEYYWNNCGPDGCGGPYYFNTQGEPIEDEEEPCYGW